MKLLLIAAVAILSLTAQTRTATLTWTDTQTNVTYRVYRSLLTPPANTCAPLPTMTLVSLTPITTKTFTDPGLSAGTYCYVVTAFMASVGESAYSTPVSATALPFPPSGLTIGITMSAIITITPTGTVVASNVITRQPDTAVVVEGHPKFTVPAQVPEPAKPQALN